MERQFGLRDYACRIAFAMRWLSLDSSALKAAAYVADERALYLKFQSGEVYRYFDVPPKLYEDFLAADSKGTFFGQSIREQFRYERLPRTRRAGG